MIDKRIGKRVKQCRERLGLSQEEFAEKIDFPVRKCAHASEYAVLGVLILGAAYSFSEDRGKKRMLLCWWKKSRRML